jgi:hypothetical protein
MTPSVAAPSVSANMSRSVMLGTSWKNSGKAMLNLKKIG